MLDLSKAPAMPFGLARSGAATYLGLSVSSFDRLVATGVLPGPRQLGGSKRWVRTELEAALLEAPASVRPGAVEPPAEENSVDAALRRAAQ